MGEWIVEVIARGGYLGIAVLMALENIIPPIPSELIMGAAGVALAEGRFRFWPLLWWGTLGSTLGNYAWFFIAHRLGYQRLQPFVHRWGRWLTMTWADVEASTAFFRRHGQWIVFAMRFSPFFRTLISVPAGLARMSHWRFLAFTFAGAAVWNALLIGGGVWASGAIHKIDAILGPVIGVTMLAAFGWYLWRVWRWRE
jgi:membrane protein DedA with SNARE-associated domain